MDTFKLRALMTAIKYKNFSRAAEEYSYTPSAFSHMAHSLNDELGITLFKRTSTGVELTPDGEVLYDKICALVAAEDALLHSANELAKRKKLELQIGAYSSISKNLLPEMLKKFKEANPNIHVSLSVSVSLRGWISKNRADIVFGDYDFLKGDEWFPIMEDPFVAVVPESFFPDRKSISFDELYDYPFIATNESAYKHYIEKEKFKELIPFESEDDAAVISMVREGIGVAILSRLACTDIGGGVKTIELSPAISRSIGLAYKKNHSVATEKFIAFLKEFQAH